MIDGKLGVRTAAWLMVACGLPSLAWAGDGASLRPDRAQVHGARNDSGVAVTISSNGFIDQRNPFFRELGANGRSCASCHQPQEGWSITPKGLRERFQRTQGMDPVFRLNDGANSPLADVSTRQAREKAYSLLLEKGLIRVGLPIPANAEFELAKVDDPYGFASASELSLFRRPLPTTNLRFLNTVMWDGRETLRDAASTNCLFGTTTCFAPLHVNLASQANDATLGHAQATRAAHDGAARRDRRFRARPHHRPAERRRRRTPRRPRCERRPDVPVERRLLLRHQRHAGRRLPEPRRLHARRR